MIASIPILLNSLLKGSMAMIAPTNPIIVAKYLLQLTFSFKKIAAGIGISKGVVLMMVEIAARGT